MKTALAALALAASAHSPAYVLSGHPALGHGAETVAVQLHGCVRDVTVYASPASGDYEAFTPAAYDRSTHRWNARFTFTRQDESGPWFVTSTTAVTCSGRSVQLTSPDPSFNVRSTS